RANSGATAALSCAVQRAIRSLQESARRRQAITSPSKKHMKRRGRAIRRHPEHGALTELRRTAIDRGRAVEISIGGLYESGSRLLALPNIRGIEAAEGMHDGVGAAGGNPVNDSARIRTAE